jgi:ribosomal protein L35
MRKSFAKRIKITKNGKIIHRLMAVDHFKSKKSGQAIQAKRKSRSLEYPNSKITRLAYSYSKIAKS